MVSSILAKLLFSCLILVYAAPLIFSSRSLDSKALFHKLGFDTSTHEELQIDVGSSFRSVPGGSDPIHNAHPPLPLNAPTHHFTKEVSNIDVGSSFRSDPYGYDHIHDGAP